MNQYGFLKVAAAVPHVAIADCATNLTRILALAEKAVQRGVEIIAFPELSLTAYTCGDLLLQPALLDATEEALATLVKCSRKLPLVILVGAPLRHNSAIYNCALVIAQGRILGVVPKSYIPDYSEFFENRVFTSGAGITDDRIIVAGEECDFGVDLTFQINGAEFGVEICEDLWVARQPSSQLALDGAKIIFNLSASPEAVGKHAYLRQLIIQQSARTMSAYVYASAGFGESSTDLVFAGKGLIAENGVLVAETERFSMEEQLIVADVDVERLAFVRRRNTSFRVNESGSENTVIEMEMPDPLQTSTLDAHLNPTPFLPAKDEEEVFYQELFEIQSHGLANRMQHINSRCAILGISGGLDSTLALLAVVRTFDKMGWDRKGIIGVTMPGFGTSGRTYQNALELMSLLGITQREISIREACLQHFRDLGLDPRDRSAAYENSQARERTQLLMDLANMVNGIVVGTGDLSELALGWATYNGDHMSMYGVNGSIPKTLVRSATTWAADHLYEGRIAEILHDVVATPVSPELLPTDEQGKIAQKTEDLVGPYELHDFFLYHFIESGYSPEKMLYVAEQTFRGEYDRATILKWLKVFFRRFFTQQFKRSAMPDGPKVGVISLSPRGSWRMPSDASAAVWLGALEKMN